MSGLRACRVVHAPSGLVVVPGMWTSRVAISITKNFLASRRRCHRRTALLDFERESPVCRLAHPRTEHLAPLFVTLGAAEEELSGRRTVIDGYWLGMAKRSIQTG